MIPSRFLPLEAHPSPVVSALIRDGFCIIRGRREASAMRSISTDLDERFEKTPFGIGKFHGERTKRFHRLLARCSGAADLATDETILGAAKAILGEWCDFPELNLTQGVEIHPGALAQIPHCDQAMWPMPKGTMEFCVNVFWPLTSFTLANGATRVWPETHRHAQSTDDVLDQPVVCTMEPGDALVVLGSTIHGAGANRSTDPRRAIIISYCLGWLKAYENQSLAYSPEFVRDLDPELAALLGFRWHRPNLGTYDGQCPSILLQDDVPDSLATIDALSSAHEELVANFAARQGSAAPRARGKRVVNG